MAMEYKTVIPPDIFLEHLYTIACVHLAFDVYMHVHIPIVYYLYHTVITTLYFQTTNPNESPFEGIKDYHRWENFLSEELSAIEQGSGPGDL